MNGLTVFSRHNRHALRRLAGCVGVAAAVLALGACAPMPAGPVEYDAGRTRVVLPSPAWQDLGKTNEVLPFFPTPDAFPLQTRAVGLRGDDQAWLAVILVQSNRGNYPREHTLWTGNCPTQRDLLVEDPTQASPVRLDCLRLKRWANNDGWLDRNHPELARWVVDNKLGMDKPYSHLSYRYATEGGAYIEVNALVDQRLLRPATNNNEAFLRAGRPAQAWSHQLRDAAKLSVGMVDGAFLVPDFPLPMPKTAP